DIARLSHPNQHCVFRPPARFRLTTCFGPGHKEGVSVQVNRVMVHAQVCHPDSHAAAMTNHQWRGVRACLAVEGQPVELHVCAVGYVAIGEDGPLLQHDSEVMIDLWCPGLLGVDDEQTNHPQHLLHRPVRVVEERPCLMQRELVDEPATRCDWLLTDVRHAVHAHGNFQAVPVDAGGLGEMVLENDSHVVALVHLDRRTWAGSVVAPDFHLAPRNKPSLYRLSYETEFLRSVHHLPGQLRNVWGFDQYRVNGTRTALLLDSCAHRLAHLHVVLMLRLRTGKCPGGCQDSSSQAESGLQKTTSIRHNVPLYRASEGSEGAP